MNQSLKLLMPLAVVLMAASMTTPVYAASCGDYVQPNNTLILTQDLNCPGSAFAALTIPFGNATINLNGYTITCTGANCGPGASSVGISSDNVSVPNVKIIGPGRIVGFGIGIRVEAYPPPTGNATGLSISQVTIAGPGQTGIFVANSGASSCVPGLFNLFNPTPPNFAISNSQISGQVRGIYIENSHCGEINNNLVADNNGVVQSMEAVGIELIGDNNWVHQNAIAHNGFATNLSWLGGGIYLVGSHNQVSMNYLTVHHAYGIQVNGSSNWFYLNTARFTNNTGYDMIDVSPSQNSWNANNVCNTQQGLPAGVCNPGE